MGNISFVGSKIISLEFSNERVEKKGAFNIESTINTTANYNEESKKCTCVFHIDLKSKDADVDFSFKIKILGVYSYEGDDKKEIHIEMINALYPYVQATVMTLMSTLGFPNFLLPKGKLSYNDVIV